MMSRTSNRNMTDHPAFSFAWDADKVPPQDAQWLCDVLERGVSCGHRHAPGDTIQIGWMVNLISGREDQTLAILEPDLRTMPIKWIDSVTTTLQHLRLQKDAVDSVGLLDVLAFPSICESALMGVDVTLDTGGLLLERAPAEGSDSGWFMGDADSQSDYDDPANLRRVSLYDAARLVPRCVMFMALPPGTRVLLSPGSAQVSYLGAGRSFGPGTLLARAFAP
jgi:hypothetical protein